MTTASRGHSWSTIPPSLAALNPFRAPPEVHEQEGGLRGEGETDGRASAPEDSSVDAAQEMLERLDACEVMRLDTSQVGLILRSLLANEVKFSHPGSTITVVTGVALRRMSGRRTETGFATGPIPGTNSPHHGRLPRTTPVLRFAVHDEGCGMTSEQQRALFRPFARLRVGEAERGKRGTGLSLAIARIVVEEHGGTIGGWSAGPDCGSTFWVELPSQGADADGPTLAEHERVAASHSEEGPTVRPYSPARCSHPTTSTSVDAQQSASASSSAAAEPAVGPSHEPWSSAGSGSSSIRRGRAGKLVGPRSRFAVSSGTAASSNGALRSTAEHRDAQLGLRTPNWTRGDAGANERGGWQPGVSAPPPPRAASVVDTRQHVPARAPQQATAESINGAQLAYDTDGPHAPGAGSMLVPPTGTAGKEQRSATTGVHSVGAVAVAQAPGVETVTPCAAPATPHIGSPLPPVPGVRALLTGESFVPASGQGSAVGLPPSGATAAAGQSAPPLGSTPGTLVRETFSHSAACARTTAVPSVGSCSPSPPVSTPATERVRAFLAAGHVLVVDDMRSTRMLLRRTVQRLGATRVTEAAHGREALEAVAAAQRDGAPVTLMLCDREMPTMNGPEAIRTFVVQRFRGLIVGVTGSVMEADLDDMRHSGAHAVCRKPVQRDHLASVIDDLIRTGTE